MSEIPFDQIQSIGMIIGENCRVESLTTNKTRTLTITTEEGIICLFRGDMEFTWLVPPRGTPENV